MTRFDTILIVDWSARSSPSPKRPAADAIWLGSVGPAGTGETYHRTRTEAMADIEARIVAERAAGRRMLIGFDFPFGYPAGFAEAVTGRADAMAVWEWLAGAVKDALDNTNNRFDVASHLNALFPGIGPFWGRPANVAANGVPEKGTQRADHGLPERRAVEAQVARAQPVWKLYTTGSVGSQTLLGLPRLWHLREKFGSHLSVWPFEIADAPIVLAEVYPSLLGPLVAQAMANDPAAAKDALQVRLLAGALAEMSARGTLGAALDAASGPALVEEGWILGAGAEQDLMQAAQAAAQKSPPPRLKNDCFALPPGVNWIPVDQALATLKGSISQVVGTEILPLPELSGRILAADVKALRANPPAANSAVDGYGFAHASLGAGAQMLPLVNGRAAAGEPYPGAVPPGQAIRILTGALLPKGVDTVILQEDVTATDTHVAFGPGIHARANTRKAAEDVQAGAVILPKGHRLRPQDCALLAATGCSQAPVFNRLRVGVLSTGNEVVAPGSTNAPDKTFDANRPMLLSLVAAWGYAAVDLGHVPDDRAALRDSLDAAARQADVILTSGGASAGDEDHVSALLTEAGAMSAWRIAIKPGRPLALGIWNQIPVFGLPGNPVAALVCALIFARPAFSVMAGGDWIVPQAFTVPAAFEKRKKPGRREYLRARLTPAGHAEVFQSEGSGRISGLSWARGLVELDDGATDIRPGDPLRYIPYESFGI
ncbi:MAG: gephyrin-like molybdotransferase Glp [Paracoccaceae bacterium]